MERDTIYIRKANEQTKSDYDLNFHIDLEYRKATLTERFGNYVITFTQPKTAGSPKKVTMTISGKDYLFREMETSNEGTTMTMRLTRRHLHLRSQPIPRCRHYGKGRIKIVIYEKDSSGAFVLKAMKENYGPMFEKRITKENMACR